MEGDDMLYNVSKRDYNDLTKKIIGVVGGLHREDLMGLAGGRAYVISNERCMMSQDGRTKHGREQNKITNKNRRAWP
jgi:hypothetical protein